MPDWEFEKIRSVLNLVLWSGLGVFALVTLVVEAFGWEPGPLGKGVLLVFAVGWLIGFCGLLGWAAFKKSGTV